MICLENISSDDTSLCSSADFNAPVPGGGDGGPPPPQLLLMLGPSAPAPVALVMEDGLGSRGGGTGGMNFEKFVLFDPDDPLSPSPLLATPLSAGAATGCANILNTEGAGCAAPPVEDTGSTKDDYIVGLKTGAPAPPPKLPKNDAFGLTSSGFSSSFLAVEC